MKTYFNNIVLCRQRGYDTFRHNAYLPQASNILLSKAYKFYHTSQAGNVPKILTVRALLNKKRSTCLTH